MLTRTRQAYYHSLLMPSLVCWLINIILVTCIVYYSKTCVQFLYAYIKQSKDQHIYIHARGWKHEMDKDAKIIKS